LLSVLTAWLAPFLVFTAEEAWEQRPNDFPWDNDVQTVHQRNYPDLPAQWLNAGSAAEWERLRTIRRVVTGAIEVERAEKRIGSSLEAHPIVYINNKDDFALSQKIDWAELAITSQCDLKQGSSQGFTLADVEGVSVVVNKAAGQKCARSWKILPEVGSDKQFPELTLRDADAVRYYQTLEKAA
jgi:isoleucyl-tRNA synthetase